MNEIIELDVRELSLFELSNIEGGKAEWLLSVAVFCVTQPILIGSGLFLWGVYNGYNS